MGRSPGAGSPLRFKCPRCRRLRFKRSNLVRTGRERPYYNPSRSCLGSRSTPVSREYFCRRCGHKGWSNHSDVALLDEIW